MTKIINLEKKGIKQDKIINVAQTLFYQKGYDKTSVNEIIKKIDIAKGTFYHYFESKEDLLDKMVGKIVAGVMIPLKIKLRHKNLNAIDKLKYFFQQWTIFKIKNIEFFQWLVRIMYKKENLLLRHKIQQNSLKKMAPFISEIIKQGQKEGLFSVSNPRETAEIIMYLSKNIADNMGPKIAKEKLSSKLIKELMDKSKAYEQAIIKLLGIKDRSISLFDFDQLGDILKKVEKNH
jgi:AcrR family transcriptional regulator